MSVELSEEQLNEMGEILLERMGAAVEEEKVIDTAPEPALSKEVPENPVTQLSPVGQEEVAGELARAQQDPVVPKQMTRQVWKQMMRMHFTVRRARVKSCGHKFNIESDPRNNCDDCWFAYFQNNGQMTKIADECFTEAGRDVLERSRGKKFVRYFLRFMSTIARFQREAAELAEREKANGVEIESTAPSSDRGDSTTDSGEPRVVGEARNIGGISESSDPSVGSETAVDEGSTEGLGTGIGTV
jgi:hypothetical protein